MFLQNPTKLFFALIISWGLPFTGLCQVAPGGVSVSLAMWNKANTGVTTSGTNVTGWVDQTSTNTFTVTGTPSLQSAPLNYNPTIQFNGSSRFTGNTAISNITQAFAVGKIVNSVGTASGAIIGSSAVPGYQYFFHTQGNTFYCGGNVISVYTGFNNGGNSTPYSLFSEDLGKTPAASDLIRINGANQSNTIGQDPAVISSAIPTIGARGTENIASGSEIAEAILYNSSQSAANVNKIESYLAIKYGITLSNNGGGTAGDYTSTGGTTVWDASNGSTYHNNVIGIGRDDNSGLNQKQSHQTDDLTRVYLSTLASTNTGNGGSFSSNGQFLLIGNNAATLSNSGSTEYPAGIGARIDREWKVTNTNFSGTFSMDITPTVCNVTTSQLRLLVDADGDFSAGATTYSSASGLTFTYSGGVITIAGITTTMIPTNSTAYITLAEIPIVAGTASSAQTILTNTSPANLTLSGYSNGTITKWQYSSDNFASDVHDIASSNSATLTSVQMGTLSASRYYRAVMQNTLCATAYSSSVLISTIATAPGGVTNNLYLWTKSDAGVTVNGSQQVSQWTNQAATAMTTQATKTANSDITLNSNDFNYNPTLVYTGASSQVLSGTYTTASANPALLFAVIKRTGSSSTFLGNPFSLGPAGASAIGYDGLGAFAIDYAGGMCAGTGNLANSSAGIARVDYNSATNSSGGVAALNDLVTVSTCGSHTVSTADGTFQIGGRTYGSQPARVFAGELAEVIHYNVNALPNGSLDINKIESYLAVKYGITLDNSAGGSAGTYTSSGGTTIWSPADGNYQNNVIGIGRDDNSGLNQKQSHQADDVTRVYLSSLASSNAGNGGTFSSDQQFVLVGDNAGALMMGSSNHEVPAGLGIYSRIDREWRIANSSFTGTFSMDVKLSVTPIHASDLRILIDDDGDFSSGATLDNPSISYAGGVVTISGLSNSEIPTGSTKYITIVSMSQATPLPIKLISFTAKAVNNNLVALNWGTATETNNAYFIIERSLNTSDWEEVARVNSAGNSVTAKQYNTTDSHPYYGTSYYRLKQTDMDGNSTYSNINPVKINRVSSEIVHLFPNPSSNIFTLKTDSENIETLQVFNELGLEVTARVIIGERWDTGMQLNFSNLPAGMYFIKANNAGVTAIKL